MIDKLLALSPARRLPAAEAIHHRWFRDTPLIMPKAANARYRSEVEGSRQLGYGSRMMVEEVEGISLVKLLSPWLDEAQMRYERFLMG